MKTTTFWNNLHHVHSKLEDWSQAIQMRSGAINPEGLKRKAKIGYGHLCMREEKFIFIHKFTNIEYAQVKML